MSWVPGLPGEGSGSGGSGSSGSGGTTVQIQQVIVVQEAGIPASAVAIVNAALAKLGADRITSLNEQNNRARIMRERYPQVLEAELHRHTWAFSVGRVALAETLPAPLSDYARQFELPIDYIRLLQGADIVETADLSDYRGGVMSTPLYSIEGRKLLTNLGAPLDIRYVKRVTDTSLYNPSFIEALAARLADETCYRITQSDSKQALCKADYRDAIREAVRASAIEKPPQSLGDDSWIAARNQ